MGIYSEKAEQYFREGYNCAQSVFLAFAELYELEPQAALKLSSSFGAGMGRLREVCGAVSAMFAVAGLECGYTDPTDNTAKTEHYKLIQNLAEKFQEQHQTIVCRELLKLPIKKDSPTPSERTEQYYKVRPCVRFVKTACDIIETQILNERRKDLPVEECRS